MSLLTAKFIRNERNIITATINYWYQVDGVDYALLVPNHRCGHFSNDGKIKLLDCNGCVIDKSNDTLDIKNLLINSERCDSEYYS